LEGSIIRFLKSSPCFYAICGRRISGNFRATVSSPVIIYTAFTDWFCCGNLRLLSGTNGRLYIVYMNCSLLRHQAVCSWRHVTCSVDHCVQPVPFNASPRTAALSHRKPASAEASRDTIKKNTSGTVTFPSLQRFFSISERNVTKRHFGSHSVCLSVSSNNQIFVRFHSGKLY
jgi:hypothetical protein